MISSGLWKMGSWKITLINKGMAYQKQFETLRKMALKICQTWIQKKIYDYKKKSYKIAKEQRQLQVKNKLPGRLGTASHQLNWNCSMPHCMQVVVDAKDAHTKYYVQYSIFLDVIYQWIKIMPRCWFEYCKDCTISPQPLLYHPSLYYITPASTISPRPLLYYPGLCYITPTSAISPRPLLYHPGLCYITPASAISPRPLLYHPSLCYITLASAISPRPPLYHPGLGYITPASAISLRPQLHHPGLCYITLA